MTAAQQIPRMLSEVFLDQFERPLDIDMSDPMDVALVSGFRLLSRAFEERQKEGHSRRAVQRVLESEPPFDLAREYPAYDPGALLILAWAAKVDQEPRPVPSRVVWANHILRNMLDGAAAAEGRDSDLPVDQAFGDFLNQAVRTADGKGDPRSIGVIRDFREALVRAPYEVLDRTLQELRQTHDTLIVSPPSRSTEEATSSSEFQIEIFRYFFELEGFPHLILGVRVQEPAGVFLRFGAEGNQAAGRHFDIYAVWKIALPHSMGPEDRVNKQHFVSVQGVFIPVDLRHQLEENRQFLQDQWRTAALVARNLSHNLGSHAMLHLTADLSDGRNIESEQLATFLRYLIHRSDIVAMLASSPGHPFSVALPPRMMVQSFNSQNLLREYLCRTEGMMIAPLELLGDLEILVDCPGGLVGSQALCAILENFARNSAKHSDRREPKLHKVQMCLEFEACNEASGSLLRCRLWDRNAAEVDEKRLAAIRQATRKLLTPEANSSRAHASHQIGLGTEETVTWARYLRQVRGRCDRLDPPVIDYERVDGGTAAGSLTLVFYLPRMRDIQSLCVTDLNHSPLQPIGPAQLNFLACKSMEELLKSGPLPGRWLKVTRKPGGSLFFRSRFHDLETDSLSGVLEDPLAPLQVYDAYLHTLKNSVLDSADEGLDLVIVDGPRFNKLLDHAGAIPFGLHRREVPLGLEGVRCHVVAEVDTLTLKRFTVAQVLDDLDAPGKVAIWHRHASSLPSTADHPRLRDQLIHYEVYNSPWNDEYDQILDVGSLEKPRLAALLAVRLAECALLRGFVIDERFRAANEVTEQRLAWAGVRRIDPFSPEYGSLPDLLDRIERLSESPWEGARLRPSFLTIHASLARSSRLMCNARWTSLLERLRARMPCIALHSGRGGVEEVEGKRLPFLPASLLQQRLFDNPAKLFFIEALVRGGWLDAAKD